VNEALRQRQSAADLAEQRLLRHEHIAKTYPRMIGRHVEGPHVFFDPHSGAVGWHQKTADAARIAVIA
jgi:hypothetical protein